MYLICINNISPETSGYKVKLTIGKIYETFTCDEKSWCVINDVGFKMFYTKKYNFFITQEKFRNKLIKNILYDEPIKIY